MRNSMEKQNDIIKLLFRVKTMGGWGYIATIPSPLKKKKEKRKEKKAEWSFLKSGTFSENKIIKQYSTVRDDMDVNQEGNKHSYIEEGHTIQWPKEKRTEGQTTIYKTYT